MIVKFDEEQFFRASLDRMQIEQIGIGQLHWSTANYAPLQELALWDGLVAMYEKVTIIYMKIETSLVNKILSFAILT
jgi:aryl-alcohol dehydrogenase-like predicted oxidoreductase